MTYAGLTMFFGLLWICAFLRAKTTFVVMVSATTYYFDSNKDHEGDADVGLGFRFTYVYHLGSLAMGSFILAVVQFLRICVLALEQMQKASGENAASRYILACANCMMKCIEDIVEYMNEAAYAYMAVSGDSFCTSAWNGFLLHLKHTMKFAWANFLASAFIFIGKIGLVALNTFCAYSIMKHVTKDLDEISSPVAPLVIVALATYISSSIFLGMFDETVHAMMTCLAIDIDLNGYPKYGPPTFHDSLSKVEAPAKSNAIQDGGWEKQKNDMA